MDAAARPGHVPVGRDRVSRRRRCPASARRQRTCTRRARSAFDWRTVARLCAARRLLRRHRARLHRPRRGVRLPAGRLRGDPALPDPARNLGDLAPRAGADHVRPRAISRSRSSCCRRSAADPRCAGSPAGASATATACCCRRSGGSWPTASSTRAVFYDAGKVAARTADLDLQRPEERLRLRRALPRAVRHAAARRGGQEQRRHCGSCSRRHPFSEAADHVHIIVHDSAARLGIGSCRWRRSAGVRRDRSTTAPRFYPTIRSRASPSPQDASKAQPYRDRIRCTR